MKKSLSCILLALLLTAAMLGGALADAITMSGTVVSIRTETITALMGGTVEKVLVSAGDHVSAGDALATLKTEKVYALQNGTARLFGEVGDSTDMLSERYGAVIYIEPECQYTVSATTKNAYDSEANKTIHPGETVYMKSVDNSRNTGSGVVTSVTSTGYKIEVLDGSFEGSESVYVYRNAAYTNVSRIGRGTVSRQDPIAYTGSGIIVSYNVEDGAAVKKGDVLFETLSGTYTNHGGDLRSVTVSGDGVVASITMNRGAAVAAGDAVAEFYADEDMRVEAKVLEADLQSFRVGDTVTITFTYLDNGEYQVKGVVEKISRTSAAVDEETNEASYSVLVKPASTERLSYGMNAVVEQE